MTYEKIKLGKEKISVEMKGSTGIKSFEKMEIDDIIPSSTTKIKVR